MINVKYAELGGVSQVVEWIFRVCTHACHFGQIFPTTPLFKMQFDSILGYIEYSSGLSMQMETQMLSQHIANVCGTVLKGAIEFN